MPTLLLVWLASIVVGVLGFLVCWLIAFFFTALDDGSGVGASMGVIFGQISSIPFSLLQGLISVLFTAIPALYYQRGEGVVAFSDAYSLLMARLGRYLLAGVLFTIASTMGIFFVYCQVTLCLSRRRFTSIRCSRLMSMSGSASRRHLVPFTAVTKAGRLLGFS